MNSPSEAAQEINRGKSQGRKWRVVASFAALGFTTSVMNGLNETPGATQAYLPLIFAFAGGFTLTYASLAKENPELRWSVIDLAAIGILALCVGMLFGLPTGICARVWGTRMLTGPHATRSSGSIPVQARQVGVTLHSNHPCVVASEVLVDNRDWLTRSEEGRLIDSQYRLLLERAGCEPVR